MRNSKIHKITIDIAPDFVFEIAELGDDALDQLFDGIPERAQITSPDAYIDYILAKTIVNLKEFITFLKTLDTTVIDPKELRIKAVQEVWNINPLTDPDNVVINPAGVFRLLTNENSAPHPGEIILTETPAWKKDKSAKTGGKESSIVKPVGSLKFIEKKKWWKRINQYVRIKKYQEEDVYSLIGGKYFHSRTNFNTFIVSICIVDYEELFMLLDEMGIPKHVAPPLLMLELYELCVSCNPFLTHDNSKKFFDKDEDASKNKDCSSDSCQKSKTTTAMGKAMESKAKKRFSDVSKEDLLNLETNMKVFLIGQDEAVHSMCNAIQRASVGLKEPQKPIGSFLLAGRSGCGKTLSSKILADALIKDRNNLVNIDCSEYSSDHEYSKLIGAAPGYVGYDQGGFLTNAMMTNPFSVVVFDEIEKASYKLHQLLLQILEEGRLTDGKGQAVSFRDAIIIMTSNIGVEDIDGIKNTIGFGDVTVVTDEKKDKLLYAAIKKKFRPEFLNRIDDIIYFKELTKDDYMRIIDLELYRLNDNLKANDTEYSDLFLRFDHKVRNLVFKQGINSEYGARPLKRFIETKIATPLAKCVLAEYSSDKAVVQVGADKDDITFQFMTQEEADKTRNKKIKHEKAPTAEEKQLLLEEG